MDFHVFSCVSGFDFYMMCRIMIKLWHMLKEFSFMTATLILYTIILQQNLYFLHKMKATVASSAAFFT